jgi:hypothetical protein
MNIELSDHLVFCFSFDHLWNKIKKKIRKKIAFFSLSHWKCAVFRSLVEGVTRQTGQPSASHINSGRQSRERERERERERDIFAPAKKQRKGKVTSDRFRHRSPISLCLSRLFGALNNQKLLEL